MISRFLLLMLLALPLIAAAQDSAFTNRSTELKERAEAKARPLARLAENTPVKILSRAGQWTRVEAAGQSGWINVFHLRYAGTVEAAPSSAGGGVLSSIGAAVTGQRPNAQANLATTGVRGLSKDQLRNSNPNPEELRRMQSYRADRTAAERLAREGRLAEAQIDNQDEAPAPRRGRR